MHNGIKYTLIFSCGAAVGVAASWKIFETKYNRILDEERIAIKDYYKNKYEKSSEPTEAVDENPETPVEDEEIIVKTEYKKLINDYVGEGGSDAMEFTKPRILSPAEFGDIENYETETLTYYANDVLTDDWGNIIEDPEDLVGTDFMHHFDVYEDDPDTVYVRNEKYRADYEICRDEGIWDDPNSKDEE